jgi:hypothetical protein
MEDKDAAATFSLRGWSHWEHIRDGKVIDVRDIPNAIVNAGKAQVAYMINQTNTGTYLPFTYIEIGTGTTAATATDTGLGAAITTAGGGRASATVTRVTTSVADDTAQLTKTFTFTTGGTFNVSESGVFNSSTGAPMLCRQTFAAIPVLPNDTLAVTWKIQVS